MLYDFSIMDLENLGIFKY